MSWGISTQEQARRDAHVEHMNRVGAFRDARREVRHGIAWKGKPHAKRKAINTLRKFYGLQ
jgi:hypothetical protein